MSARDEHHRDPEEAAMIEESKRLVAQMDELIRRAKILQFEHRGIVERIRERRRGTADDPEQG